MNQKAVIIGGPTGSGKSRLALELALHVPCEIINADSRQIYRELVIGTNQPSVQDRTAVPHHLFGFLEPTISFSAADYERLAAPLLQEIGNRSHLPVVVGGTGFYIKALLKGLWPVPAKQTRLRMRLRKIEEKRGRQFLHRMLERFDPASATKIPVNDVYRVIRALEIFIQSGQKRSEIQTKREDRFSSLKYFLNPDRLRLHANIEKRTERMIENGWIQEVEGLLKRYPGFEEMPAAASLGYAEIIAYLRGETDLDHCKEKVILKTKQYSKRQLTWFRNQDGFARLHSNELHKILDSVLQWNRDR